MTDRLGVPLAVLRDGSVWSWRGDLRPEEQPTLRGTTAYAASRQFICFLMQDRTVRCAGNNEIRACGPPGVRLYGLHEAQTIPGLRDITQVAAISYTAYALRSDGQLFRWAKIRHATRASDINTHEPELVPEFGDVVRIGGGEGGDLLVLRRDGSVWSLHLPTEDGLPLIERVVGFGPP